MFTASRALAQENRFDRPQRVDTTLSLDKNGTVSVSIFSGRVNVVGTSGSQVRIRGTTENDELEIRNRYGGVSVSLEPESGHGGRAELDITVPVGTNVILESQSAPLSVRGVKGGARLEAVSGDLEVFDAEGDVSTETVSGSIIVNKVDGEVRAEAVSGSIGLTDVKGGITSESVSGRINIVRANTKAARAETVSGSIGYSGSIDPMGNYVFKTHSGRLTLGFPPNAGATLSLQTFSGSVDSDFPMTMENSRGRVGHETSMEFKVGDGRSRIVLETFSGDIFIQRNTNRDSQE